MSASDEPKPTPGSSVEKAPDAFKEEHGACSDFKPIIRLPDEVEANTGDESEVVLLKERATLYRYVEEEWREKGVGDLKLMKNSATGKVRLLMYRHQIYEVCSNHYFSTDMELQTSDHGFVWCANDYAGEQMRLEMLRIQFRYRKQAEHFKKTFNAAKASVAKLTDAAAAPQTKTNKKK